MTNHLYIFSGLGADQRIFQHIDFSGFAVTHIQWITPLKNESLENYASRFAVQIKTEKPILLGVSFGGMIAVEIAKHIDVEKVIIISSAKTKNEIPYLFRLAGKLGVCKILPGSILKVPNFITYWLFGVSAHQDKLLLKQIFADTDARFLKWALNAIANWKNITVLKNVMHLHGTKDKVLPYKYIHDCIKVTYGGHFMTLNRAKEISRILKELL